MIETMKANRFVGGLHLKVIQRNPTNSAFYVDITLLSLLEDGLPGHVVQQNPDPEEMYIYF